MFKLVSRTNLILIPIYKRMLNFEIDTSEKRVPYRSEEERLPLKVQYDNPFDLFKEWFNECIEKNVMEPNAVCLSTCSKELKPSSRYVLMKACDRNHGFLFFTNYDSKKGREIADNPNVSLLFYWEPLKKQVRIEGSAVRVSDDLNDKYFNSRPLASRVAAISSPQSSEVVSREIFLDDYRNLLSTAQDQGNNVIKRPQNWGGFLVKPIRYEFWLGQSSRFHDRLCYEIKNDEQWRSFFLAP